MEIVNDDQHFLINHQMFLIRCHQFYRKYDKKRSENRGENRSEKRSEKRGEMAVGLCINQYLKKCFFITPKTSSKKSDKKECFLVIKKHFF